MAQGLNHSYSNLHYVQTNETCDLIECPFMLTTQCQYYKLSKEGAPIHPNPNLQPIIGRYIYWIKTRKCLL